MDAVKSDSSASHTLWSVYEKDFFPLMTHEDHKYWVGYFSSRPDFKALLNYQEQVTYASNFLYSTEFLRDNSKTQIYEHS